MQLRAALAALACLLALAGCGSADRAPDPVARAGAVPALVVPEAPAGHRMVEIDSGLAFAIPEAWSEVSPRTTDEPDPRFDEVLGAMGMNRQQFEQLLEQLDAFFAAPAPVGGFMPNLNVVAQSEPLPGDAGIRAQYRAIGASDVQVEEADSWLGEAVVTSFTLDFGRVGRVYAGAVGVPYGDGDGCTIITVSAATPEGARALRDVVLATVHESDPRRSTVRSGT